MVVVHADSCPWVPTFTSFHHRDGDHHEPARGLPRAARTGYLPQDPSLFSGTVRENIVLGSATLRQAQDHTPNATIGRPVLASAVSCAALGEDLRTLPAGLETEIGERGIRVSGGQRQPWRWHEPWRHLVRRRQGC